MSNTINVNGMTEYYNSFIQTVTKKSAATKTAINGTKDVAVSSKSAYSSVVESKVEVSSVSSLHKTEQTEAISTKDMTLEEYKQYISDKISSFPFCADAMNDSYSINISDEGFRAMQNDPEYEKWVLDDLRTAFSTPMPGWTRKIGGTKYQVVHYGATKEECHSTSWWTGYQGGNGANIWESQSKESFWSKRGGQKRIQEQIDKKSAKKKELEKKWLEESAEKRQACIDYLNSKAMSRTNSLSNINDIFFVSTDSKISGILSAYEAGTFVGGGF